MRFQRMAKTSSASDEVVSRCSTLPSPVSTISTVPARYSRRRSATTVRARASHVPDCPNEIRLRARSSGREGCAAGMGAQPRWGLIILPHWTQGSLERSATLGCVTESLWDSRMRSIVSSLVHRQSVDARLMGEASKDARPRARNFASARLGVNQLQGRYTVPPMSRLIGLARRIKRMPAIVGNTVIFK